MSRVRSAPSDALPTRSRALAPLSFLQDLLPFAGSQLLAPAGALGVQPKRNR